MLQNLQITQTFDTQHQYVRILSIVVSEILPVTVITSLLSKIVAVHVFINF